MIKTIHIKQFVGMRMCAFVLMLMSFAVAKAQDYTSLYMIGSATPGNWDLASATRMTPVSGSEGVFTWEGHLKKDEFKFVSNTDWYWPGFVATAANTSVERVRGSDTCYNILSLRIDEPLSVELILTCCRVS